MSDKHFTGDAYVFFPVERTRMDKKLNSAKECSDSINFYASYGGGKCKEKGCSESDIFFCYVKEASKANCSSNICEEIVRESIVNCTINIPPDTYFGDKPDMSSKADIVLVTHTQSLLAVVVLIFKEGKFDVMRLLDRVSSRKLEIFDDDKASKNKKPLIKYIEEEFNCKITGESKSLLCVPHKPDKGDMVSILSGEWRSKDANYPYNLSESVLQDESAESIGEYNFASDVYASQRVCVIVIPSIDKQDFIDRIKFEVLAVFIVELLIFQYNAIRSIGNRISLLLEKTDKLTLQMIEELHVNFGKTLIFWENDNYLYAGVQRLTNKMLKHLRLDVEQENFNRKFEQIKNIVGLRNARKTQRNDGLMMFLVLTQVIMIVIEFLGNNELVKRTVELLKSYWEILIGLGIFAVFLLCRNLYSLRKWFGRLFHSSIL